MKLITKIIKSILFRFVPELRSILVSNENIDFSWIKKSSVNNEIDEMVKFYPPYNISNSKIGKGTYIAANSRISQTTIGKFCSIGPNLVCGWGIHPICGISTSPYFYSTNQQNGFTIAKEDLVIERKPIKINNDVFIGANVTILDGITIGNGAVIGAGAVVSKDIPDFAIAVGSPIQIKRFRFTEEQRLKLKNIKWWDLAEDEFKLVNKHFFDIDEFISTIDKRI